MSAYEKQSPPDHYSSENSDSRKKQNVHTGSKRASRAGTRSVTTLTAAQLERKRANDREAQRAIRQRTKDHIENLERRIEELTSNQGITEKLIQRNKELENENALLRSRLGPAGVSLGIESQANDWDGDTAKAAFINAYPFGIDSIRSVAAAYRFLPSDKPLSDFSPLAF
ncbi:MAG: hypothetical protein Q9157_007243 [Trypethelium eluteriae]